MKYYKDQNNFTYCFTTTEPWEGLIEITKEEFDRIQMEQQGF